MGISSFAPSLKMPIKYICYQKEWVRAVLHSWILWTIIIKVNNENQVKIHFLIEVLYHNMANDDNYIPTVGIIACVVCSCLYHY